jgi:hypothetical protein
MTTTKRSTFGAGLRTTILLATLSGLFVAIGFLIGGSSTALVFLFMAALMNMGAYFFSDKIALKMSGAKPISEQEAPRLYQVVRDLCARADLPMPSLHMIPADQPPRLAGILSRAGAELSLEWQAGGHELTVSEIDAVRAWLTRIL